VERDEIEQFVTLRYAELLRTAYLLTGSTDRAEELVQTCLLKALPRWDRIADPLAYLRRAMANQRVSLWRRLRHELLSDRPPEPEPVPDPFAGPVADRTTLIAELQRLPKQMRAVLVLRYWEDLSVEATAEALGCGAGAVKSQASRGLDRLRVALGAAPEELRRERR
jgi:RNA polymerase sigma-70 factor (sigma-E family)